MGVLPRKTEKLLEAIYENDCKYNMLTFRSSSDDPNWERIKALEKLGYVLTQSAEIGPPVYFISPLGEVYLQDIDELHKEHRKKWIADNALAIFAIFISLISLVVSLVCPS